MSSSLPRFFEVMRRLDDAISDIERKKNEIKDELDKKVKDIEDKLRSDLESEIKRLISSYREEALSRIDKEVEEYVKTRRNVIELAMANRDKIVRYVVDKVLSDMGFKVN